MRRLCLITLCCCVALCCGLSAGCGRSTPTTYYVLESTAPDMASGPLPTTSLRVAPVTVPQYADKSSLVRQGGAQAGPNAGGAHDSSVSISLDDTQQWAETLPEGIRRVVQAELAGPLRQKKVHVLANADESDSDYTLFIHVERVDVQKAAGAGANAADMGAATARLSAQWRCEKDRRVVAQGVFSDSEAMKDAAPQTQVRAQSALVRRMAAWILGQLPQL